MQERIIKAALEEIKKYGFRRFTMDDIATKLKISKKTIYRSFSSKQELVATILNREFEREQQGIIYIIDKEEHWFDRLNELIALCASFRFTPELLEEASRFFPDEAKSIEMRNNYVKQQYHLLLEEGMGKGHIQPDINLDLLVVIIDELMNKTRPGIMEVSKGWNLDQRLEEIKKVVFFGIIRRDW